MKRKQTVTQGPWNVGTMTGSGIDGAILQVFRIVNNKIYRASCYGMQFPNTDAAFAYALERGYSQEYRRGWCPRCRKQHYFCGGRTYTCAAHSYPYPGCEEAQASFDAQGIRPQACWLPFKFSN